MNGFLDMGGYGAFVWPSYALSAVVLAGILIVSLRQRRANRDALERLKSETGEENTP